MVSLECRSKCEGSVGEDDNVTTLVKVEKKEEMRRISSVEVLCVVWKSV